MTTESAKRNAGRKALELIEDGMVVGLGTGSTARHFVQGLGERVAAGLGVRGIPSSITTETQARSVGIPLVGLDTETVVDVTVDGADEIDPDFHLVKGGGGALLREKILSACSRRLVIIADASKLVDRLGVAFPIPVEVVPFGLGPARRGLEALGATVKLRGSEELPFVTDNGNYILDARFAEGAPDPGERERTINAVPGVVDNGLFVGIADTVIIGSEDGAEVRTKG